MLSATGDSIVYLFDVDNTLLDNDRFSSDLDMHLTQALGDAGRVRYRALYDELRASRGYADYLEPLQHLRDDFVADPDLLRLSTFLLDYPFADRIYPGALELLRSLSRTGRTVILSDGDVVFQPRKIQRSGLWDAVQGRVHVYLHKEYMLTAVQEAYPASHYVMVDDKPGLLAAIKRLMVDRVTTVFVRQGHYSTDAALAAAPLKPDVTIGQIAQLGGHPLTMSAPLQEHG